MKEKTWKISGKTFITCIACNHLADPDRVAGCNITFCNKGCQQSALFPGTLDNCQL